MAHRIHYIDVFTDTLGNGNPVAVIFDADDLSDIQMQKIASWTNLSETTFIQKPIDARADYRLRIFTPKSELPFAGHPTIGSCYAAIKSGLIEDSKSKIIQECRAGLIEISRGETIEFQLPKAQFTALDNTRAKNLAQILGTQIYGIPSIVNVGPKWIIAELENAEAVLKANPDYAQMKDFEKSLGATGVTIYGKYQSGESFIEVRSFAPSDGINEDPVCGSGNGAVCAHMLERSIISSNYSYIARQGRAIGRDGQIFARIDNDNNIFIGGKAIVGVHGMIEI